MPKSRIRAHVAIRIAVNAARSPLRMPPVSSDVADVVHRVLSGISKSRPSSPRSAL